MSFIFLTKPQEAFPVLLMNLKIKEKLEGFILVFITKITQSFEPVLPIWSTRIGMYHYREQKDGADQRFSSFLLSTEEA